MDDHVHHAVFHQIFRPLEAVRQFLSDRLFNHAGSGKSDQRAGFGYVYVADSDSRPVGAAHPAGNLWDNGADAIEELNHLLRVRSYALNRLSAENIRACRPMATLEEVLVPIYLLHRFQLNAVGKLVGGHEYNYAMRGDGQRTTEFVSAERQRAAIVLCTYQGLSNREAAETMDISVDALESLLSRARRKLREQLMQKEDIDS